MRSTPCLLLAVALSGLSGCFELFPRPAFGGDAQEYLVRLDARADTFELVSIQHGLYAVEGDVLAHLQMLLAGRRLFPAQGGFLSADFDDLGEHASGEEPDAEDRELLELAAGLSVEEVALGLEADGRVTLWRRARLTNAAAWLEAWQPNDMSEFSLGELPTFDEPTYQRALDAYGRGERFLSLRGDSLVLEMPSTPANAAACVAELVAQAARGDDLLASLCANLRELESGDGHLRARLGPDASGWIRLGWEPARADGGEVRAPLGAEELRAAGLRVEPAEVFAKRLASVAAPAGPQGR